MNAENYIRLIFHAFTPDPDPFVSNALSTVDLSFLGCVPHLNMAVFLVVGPFTLRSLWLLISCYSVLKQKPD